MNIAYNDRCDACSCGFTCSIQDGRTALMLAVRKGRIETVHALLINGANVDHTVEVSPEAVKRVSFGF